MTDAEIQSNFYDRKYSAYPGICLVTALIELYSATGYAIRTKLPGPLLCVSQVLFG